ncbi:putative disease resistance RPP13-like protein 3 [Lolium rigidum]|uniref:putative disease resistance RPP13-like protein 3 n=1 Tax=Lolium rigidum TaxID=89674 RepID=UPI001F5C9D73|nr:putative disease resistance RPP13-like protein 3 [Lolium rigidum]
MEVTALSIGKSVLNGALSYAKSAVAEEVALQLGVRRDQVFITNELEMMQAFLMSAHDERDDNSRVVKVWVKQVRDVAYDVEDTLQEFAIRLEKKSWWRIRRTLLDQRRVAKQMKELRANVEDVSQRNMRYNLIKGSGSKASMAADQSSITSAALFGIDEARRAAKVDKSKVDLVQLINEKENDLRVISVWGTTVDLGQTSIIRRVYESLDIKGKFSCRAWVRLMNPFNPKDFVQSLVEQFHADIGVNVLLEMDKTSQELIEVFNEYVNKRRYMIVLNDLSTIEQWDRVKKCFPNNKMGSRIIVSTAQVEIASLCVGQESIVSELRQLSADQNIYAFHEKTESSSNRSTTRNDQKGTVSNSADGKEVAKKSLTRIRTMASALDEFYAVGREKEKYEIIKLVASEETAQFQVISMWGMGGLGKTTLVKDIYHNKLSYMFEKHACVTVMRPFCLVELLRSLVTQLETSEKKEAVGLMGSTKNALLLMPLAGLIKELARIVKRKRCLIVLDDVLSTAEWEMIIPVLREMENTSRIIVTTREEAIAKRCSEKNENIYKLKGLEYKDARDLFAKKETTDLDKQYPELVEQAELILRKCNRLPLAISCFLYMPIFPEDYTVGRGRLVRRWTAEGYPREVRGKSVEEISDCYFMELISRSIILPSHGSFHSTKGIDSCQVHDLIREIGISKSTEENLVFTLEEGCSPNNRATMRHLAINGNWKGNRSDFESIVDMSHVRSVTVFGKFKSFFISDKMRLLRVLDLEDTSGLGNRHLKHIGKFLHMRYLSLRGCVEFYHLPDSLGKLRELLTLDVRGTNIIKLPRSIINLQKLRYIRSGNTAIDENVSYEDYVDEFPRVLQNRPCLLFFMMTLSCILWCTSESENSDEVDLSRRDVCTNFFCTLLPLIALRLDKYGVLVPRGMRKLKALQTLGVVNIGRHGKAVLNEIKGLIQLRKLGVTGINKENGQDLCSAIVALSRLESLSIRSEGEPGLSGCLDGKFIFPENLQRLKLYGNLVKFPEWIEGLNNLVKLKLRNCRISKDSGAIKVLGDLPNLAFLHLLEKLVFLELNFYLWLRSVEFEQGATPKLEVLKVCDASYIRSGLLCGLPFLSSLKEVVLHHSGGSDPACLQAELALNPNRPVMKRV